MDRLSLPLEQLEEHYDVVVVGSGYGAGVAASRLARAGRRVAVLERGPERLPGEFPDTPFEAAAEVQVRSKAGSVGRATALFDFNVGDDLVVLTGCGLGGTSLINANVALEADPRVFEDPIWPAAIRADREGIASGVARARAMLRPIPYPDSRPPLAKYAALERSAAAMGLPVYKPPINVTFESGVNHVGVDQPACTLCGDCVSGCNVGAKNTTAMNYIPDAVNHGASVFTTVSVRHLERADTGGWVVHFDAVDVGRDKFHAPVMHVRADLVVLGAGAVGSTEILLRSRAAGLATSARVGSRFSGNGDVLGFAYDADHPIHGVGMGTRPVKKGAEPGPCITGIIDARGSADVNDGYVIEEGVVPGAVGAFNPAMFAAAGPFIADDNARISAAKRAADTLKSLVGGTYTGATDRSQTFLVMSHDESGGEVVLEHGHARVSWPGVGSQAHWAKMDDNLDRASKAVGADYYRDPIWTSMLGNRLITVHPLGGCPMAETAEHGVVDHRGHVFSGETGSAVWPDLLVLDGSIMPRSVGVNPLLTISAVAERNVALLAEANGWPLDVSLPSARRTPAPPVTPAIEFTETMRGFWSAEGGDDFAAAAAAGKQADSSFVFTLTVRAADARTFIDHPPHEGRMFGTVVAPALSAEPLTVTGGIFNLITDVPDSTNERRMRYRMVLRAEDGRAWYMDGFKRVRPGNLLHAWPDTSTLFITLREGEDAAGPVTGRGVLRIAASDFRHQLTTMRVTGARSTSERLQILADFGKVFAGILYEAYGGIAGQTSPFHDTPEPRKKRALDLPAPEVHHFNTADGITLQLTRFQGGTKGPVVLAPGFGMAASSYLADTVDRNLPEMLVAEGYDTWLFDYRASTELPSSSEPFTIDDVARHDWPAAIATVRKASGADSVQVLAHCVGSLSFQLAMLSGLTGVRSAICSALTVHPRGPLLTEVKAGLKLPSVLSAIGFKTLTTSPPKHRWWDTALDEVMRLYPTKERCHLPVCRKILFMYGEVYRHAQLNLATHEAIAEFFGVAHMKPFAQLAAMTAKGHAVDADGHDTYMPHVARLALPITFLHGELNNMFLPEGSHLTYEWLRAANGPALYRRHLIPEYAHLDCFLGMNASRDVFPLILRELAAPPASGAVA